jgi:hypothetical protein
MIFKNSINIDTQFINKCNKLDDFLNFIKDKNIKFNDLLICIRNDTKKINKILELLNIDNVFFNELNNTVSEKLKFSDRIIKYCSEYYLILIIQVKNNSNNWKYLTYNILCHNPYKSIYNQFLRWSNKNFFKKAFNNFNDKHIKKINKIHIIDSTNISNKYGNENVTINPEYKKKKVTKISILCDKNKIITATSLFKINEKEKKFKNKNIKTFVHDSKTIQETIDNTNKNIIIKKILGDGGYKTNIKCKKNNKVIKIITPNRKNQKNKLNNKKENKELKERYKIENVIGSLKMNNSRIHLRKERKEKHFLSWVYIGCLYHNVKILKI